VAAEGVPLLWEYGYGEIVAKLVVNRTRVSERGWDGTREKGRERGKIKGFGEERSKSVFYRYLAGVLWVYLGMRLSPVHS